MARKSKKRVSDKEIAKKNIKKKKIENEFVSRILSISKTLLYS